LRAVGSEEVLHQQPGRAARVGDARSVEQARALGDCFRYRYQEFEI
jgi:hypothetical protein